MENGYLTSRGIRVEFLGIAALMDKFNAARQIPQPPTYEIKTATGASEVHAHDETTLETDADKSAWAEYIRARDAEAAQYSRNFMRIVLSQGVRVEIPSDETWVPDMEFLGIPVPAEPRERKMFWLETNLAGSVEDAENIVTGVMAASGMDEEVIRSAEDAFRGRVERDPAAGADGAAAEIENAVADSGNPARTNGSGAARRHRKTERV